MKELRYTLLSDGSSDRVLLPVLTWLLRQRLPGVAVQEQWADLRLLPTPPRGLAERIRISLELYPCDLLFVHRDAEGDSREARVVEIQRAQEKAVTGGAVPVVCVVPVRMQEAWLLFHETALRRAAGNPNGKAALELPALARLEHLPDPKRHLHQLLRAASELQGRRLRKFPVKTNVLQIAKFIEDFSPLRALAAFRALEEDLDRLLDSQGW
jgi:hypothetical protein